MPRTSMEPWLNTGRGVIADACRVGNGSVPRGMAAFAKYAISVLRLPGERNMKRSMSEGKLRPNTAVRSAAVGDTEH